MWLRENFIHKIFLYNFPNVFSLLLQSEDLDMESTVVFIRQLRRYNIMESPPLENLFVREFLEGRLEETTMERLRDYTRGMYNSELHYQSFRQFEVPKSIDIANSNVFLKLPELPKALEIVSQLLVNLKETRLLRPSNFRTIRFTPGAAAGYGYKGKKRDNFSKAKKNAWRAMRGFRVHRLKYRFVPDKAFARSQLSERTNPKIRHVWGRAFHHILLEGLIAQSLYDRIMQVKSPIYIGKDLHLRAEKS
jgi:hypothetical protein